ncbi:hypothetical protein [Parasphingorhabdus sp.]|uniref:hypothetical protein n=1 Tax=Parasphingorhabdus sp. TaxID=2709688 RepID=UPI003266C94D
MMQQSTFLKTLLLTLALPFAATMAHAETWHVVLQHDKDGDVIAGHNYGLVSAIRNGCQIRIGWGARRSSDPSQTIEHIATPVWVAVRNGNIVEAQLSDFVINLDVMGEAAADHPRRERFGGTEKAVSWRATLKTDGSFNAVWYSPATGAFITRVPQRHPMKWFADCAPLASEPYFPSVE